MNTREKHAEMLESEEHEKRMRAIAQNGNNGEHYTTAMTFEQESINMFDVIDAKEVKEPTKAELRKGMPVFSGFLNYFADAVREVAKCSMSGQKQHAPDKPLQWHREKSGDELDALSRHLLEAGTIDDDGILHSAKIAWRAMANLQKELERNGEAPLSKYNKV
jgi:hypothetical protein